MKQFSRDPYFLLRDSLIWTAISLSTAGILYTVRGIDLSLQLKTSDLFVILLWIVAIGPLAAIFHGSTHGSAGPGFMNRIVGEFLGFFFLYGFRNFQTGHLLHHKYTNHPDLDPDYRLHETFFGFMAGQGTQVLKSIANFYYLSFGRNENTEFQVKLQPALIGLSMLARMIFWFVLLGPKFFFIAYLPLVIGNVSVFAHINFVTHPIGRPGAEVRNAEIRGLLRFYDFMTFGGYHHKNHHQKPRAFNHAKALAGANS